MDDKLLPCPFCGGEAAVYLAWYDDEQTNIRCMQCGATADSEEEWNTRAERTCEMEYITDFMSWHCKACDMMDMAPRNPKPRYCKWCGAKVVK